ncbi:MAG TPA: PDZ domain-containing protein [Gemmatimonadaceae bacterium]|jgi:predicted metalloprotease with PDZ domain
MRQFALLFLAGVTALHAVDAQTRVSASATTAVSAPIKDVHYDVTFMRDQAEQRMVNVTMTMSAAGTAPVLLSLPAWTPGAYEISNFSRWVVDFDASANGKPLAWDKLDYDTWRIHPTSAQTVRVSFQYAADSLDNAMTWSAPDFLLFNGTNLFMYAEGQSLDFPSTLTVHTEPDWRVTTGLTAGAQKRSYSATNFHDLVDMPFFVGRYDLDSEQIVNHWVRLATYPAASVSPQVRSTAWDQLRRVIPVEAKVFGEVPWANYTVMQIVDSSFAGASGLEHQSSHVDVLAPSYVGSAFQPSLYAHEIFHSWNVKRLRPAEMWPYEYSHAEPTTLLWVSEGITDYYADLAEVRGGVVDATGFYGLTSEKINEVMGFPPIALEDASLDTWIQPVDGTGYLYYPKGSLAGMLIDILIRDASDDQHSLDDVMRGLYQSAYKHGHGFTTVDWWAAVSAAANGKSFATFSARYVDGREPFPLDSVLALAGLRAHRDQVPRLGVVTQMQGDAIIVVNVQEGSSAAAAGVKAGDLLISVGDIPVEDQQFGAKMRAKYGASMEGSPLDIKLRRGTDTLTLDGHLRFAPGDVMVEPDPNATPKAIRIRDGILKGENQ